MPVPKRKTSKARRNKRRANKNITMNSVKTCDNCKEPRPSHTACPACGFYKGRKVFETKTDRAVKRQEVRKQAAKAQEAAPQKDAVVEAEVVEKK